MRNKGAFLSGFHKNIVYLKMMLSKRLGKISQRPRKMFRTKEKKKEERCHTHIYTYIFILHTYMS